MELADRQDAIETWFETHGVEFVEAHPLAEAGVQTSDLDALAALISDDCLEGSLAYVSTGFAGPLERTGTPVERS